MRRIKYFETRLSRLEINYKYVYSVGLKYLSIVIHFWFTTKLIIKLILLKMGIACFYDLIFFLVSSDYLEKYWKMKILFLYLKVLKIYFFSQNLHTNEKWRF